MFDWKSLQEDPASRRAFLKRMTAAGLGAAAAGLLSGPLLPATLGGPIHSEPGDAAAQFKGVPGQSIDIQVLNFALTLEILEADLYRQGLNVASGLAITTPLSSSPSAYGLKVSDGGLNSYSAASLFEHLLSFTYVEAAHRDFLHAAIQAAGGTPVAPNPKGYKFPHPLAANINDIMSSILPLEETGVRAYLGALPYLQDLNYATTAGTIYSTEARHSAYISEQLGHDPGPTKQPGDLTVVPNPPAGNTFEYYLKPSTVVAKAKTFFA
jgi:hypothetical protein